MAGDHACPVCQATFTRPQHVARHMRSHTGDRPYKCQHCGDQFSRSDLLNRHIKKCHPDAKDPNANKEGGKRKTNAINRAATSKQACDQCVQSSLPCNGANPCSKCTQRKVRCTFVMFHRQTAPVGPGHPAATPFTSNPYVDLATPMSGVSYSAPQHQQNQYTQQFNGSMGRYGRSASLNLGQARHPFDIPAVPMAEQSRTFGVAPEPHNDLSNSHIPFDFELDNRHQDPRFPQHVTNHYPETLHGSPQSASFHYQYPSHSNSQNRVPNDEQPRPSSSHFHSAFGLMSLEDPKTEQTTPFFTHAHPADVPVPHRLSPESTASSYSSSSSGFQHGSTPSSYSSAGSLSAASWKDFGGMPPRETETRELKEFWRQYQSHSPQQPSFEGPTPSLATPSATRRPRVNSFPSIKTPTADLYSSSRNNEDNYGWYPEGGTSRAAAGVGVTHPPTRPMHDHPSSQPHHGDDLQSYEAAVLARHVNTDLIMPRSKGMTTADRPNFKRLPSRVLGPDTVKKVKG